MTGKRVGYIRVSTADQNPERQLEGIKLDKKFIDYASAKDTNRPQLRMMLDFIREDDIVIVHSMDRLARTVRDLLTLVDKLISNKIQVHFIMENLIFSGQDNAMSNLLLSVMGAFAEFEYAFIKERQAEGIKIAKANGKFKGSKKKLNKEKIEILKNELKTHKHKSQIAKELGIGRATFYRYIKNLGIDVMK